MPYDGKAKKFEKEVKVLFRRSKNHLLKYSQGWASNRKLMYGRGGDGAMSGGNGIAKAFGLFRSLVSNILVTNPEVFFESTKEEYRQISLLLGDAVSWDFKIGRLHDRMIKALWQNFPYGFGAIAEDMEAKFLGPEGDQFIKDQWYFWKNIPNRDIMFDPDGFQIDLADHRMIWIAYYRSVGDVKRAKLGKEKEYFNLEDIDNYPIANEQSMPDRDKAFGVGQSALDLASNPDEADPDFRQIKIWRGYDRANECVADVFDHTKTLCRYEDWDPKIKIQGQLQFPVTLLAMNTESDDFYPTPEIDLIKPQLKNMVRLNDQLMTDLTTKIRKYLGLAPYMDQAKMGKLLDQKQPNSFILTSDVDVLQQHAEMPKIDSAADAIHKIPDVEPSADVIPGMQQIDQQIQSILAYGEASRGGLPQIRSAKEAARVADAVQKSLLGRQSELEKFAQHVAQYHVLLMKATWSPSNERYVRVTDKLSAFAIWHKLNPSKIPDEKDLFCFAYVGSSTPQTLDSKKAQFLQEMNIMAPILEKAGLSLLPLLYRYGEINSVKYMDSFTKNQKGAATMLLGAMVRAGQMGKNAPPELLAKPMMDMIDAILNPSEKQMITEAVLSQKAGGAQTGGGGGSDTPAPDPYKQTGNASGTVSMGDTQ